MLRKLRERKRCCDEEIKQKFRRRELFFLFLFFLKQER